MKGGLAFLNCFLNLFLLCAAVVCRGATDPMTEGVAAINAGQLQTAQTVFAKIATDKSAPPLNRAIAFKHLGTVIFRLGGDPTEAFKNSEQLFTEILKAQPTQAAREQYGLMLYQKANILLAACMQKLNREKMTGVQTIPFSYMKDYIQPAGESLQKAKGFYPANQAADLDLLEMELYAAETNVWLSCGQFDSAQRAFAKADALVEVALKRPAIAPDSRKKLLLRKAQLILLCNPKTPPHDVVQNTLAEALKTNSGNAELDLSVFTSHVKYLLQYDLLKTGEDLAKIERNIKAAVEKLEKLRTDNLSNMDFTARKNYFAARTELYETLIMLYARHNRPLDMLLAMNRIRSRAMQDYIDKGKITSMEQLQRILAENKGMLIAYYVGCDHVWSVRISGDSAKISRSKISGQELIEKCQLVTTVFSDQLPVKTNDKVMSLLEFYSQYYSAFRIIPLAFETSNAIYRELFEDCHREFSAKGCKHLYIMPNHVLNYLPFAALVTKHDPENVFKDIFVADSAVPITYLPSLNSLIPTTPTTTGKSNLVFARAHYNYPAYCTKDPKNPENPNAPPNDLPGVEGETNAVAQLLNVGSTGVFREKQASECNLIKMLSIPRSVVHITCHAAPKSDSPLDSYLILAAGDGEDGKVTVRELLSKHRGKFNVELLVLSACNTNLGEATEQLLPGDDVAALSNAFMVAGCRSVVSTQWPASDNTFPIIMGYFHHNISQGMPKDIALAQALKMFRDEAKTKGPEFLYPTFWGNVVLNGGKQ